MRYKLNAYNIWELGQRPKQEDSIFPEYGKIENNDRLFILCDGMGGHSAGEVASSAVCTAMSEWILKNCPDPEGTFTDEHFKSALSAAFDLLDAKDNGAAKKMGTTLTFLKLHDQGATIAHIGDSRVYHVRPGKTPEETEILFQTIDHSLVNDLVRTEVITPEEAKHSKQKNIITRAMQPRMERRSRADIKAIKDIKPGDYFMLCSDGILEQMEDENVKYIFSDKGGNIANKIEMLIKVTEHNHDNHSAIVVQITDVIDPLPLDIPEKEDTQPQPTQAIEKAPSSKSATSLPPQAGKAPRAKHSPTHSPQENEDKLHTLIDDIKSNLKYILMGVIVLLVAIIAYLTFSGKESPQQQEQQQEAAQESVAPRPTKPSRTRPTPQKPQNTTNSQPQSPSPDAAPAPAPAPAGSSTPATAPGIPDKIPPQLLTPNKENIPSSDSQNIKDILNNAEKGDAEAQLNLGTRYYKGNGVEQNYAIAFEWYKKAAQQGHPEAQNALGLCYKNGEGVEKNLAEAAKWYRKAAEQGHALAQNSLGYCYISGNGVEKDIDEAVKWYRKSAEQGEAKGEFNLGVCYEKGNGVEKNQNEAVRWYKKSAEQGYVKAQFNLGLCYIEGTGVEKNYNEAAKWFRKSAEQGEANSQLNLGICYKNGEGVEKDINEAIKWWKKSAEQGHPKAQELLRIHEE